MLPAPIVRESALEGVGVTLGMSSRTEPAPMPKSEPVVSKPAEVPPSEVKQQSVTVEPPAVSRTSRFSIRELMSAPTDDLLRKKTVVQSATAADSQSETLAEADSEQEPLPDNIEEKIYEASQSLSESLMATRPRLASVLQRVTVNGNKLCVDVPNVQLREEILLNKQELQRLFIRTMGCRVVVEFDINVVVDNSFIKPVKVEEKVRYFSEKNPDFVEFCRRLKVDVE